MSYPFINFDFGPFLCGPELKTDGSNFIDWYQDLRNILEYNDLLYIIEEPLGDEPGDSASQEDDDHYHDRRDAAIAVQCLMTSCMMPQLKSRFKDTKPYDMVDELKALFIEQIRLMKYECLDTFLSTKMEENTCLESHLRRMYDIHKRLTADLDYWMTDEFADRKSTRLNSSHRSLSRMPSSA